MTFFNRQGSLFYQLLTFLDCWNSQVFLLAIDKYEIAIFARAKSFMYFLPFLKWHHLIRCQQLADLVVIDRPGKKWRFQLVYVLLSLVWTMRLRLCVFTDETRALPTATIFYSSAGWQEREAWDMFGVFFYKHPDLRRILTDYGFSGYPLRKDFPLSGFYEQFYNDRQRLISMRPVSFAQEWRNFVSNNPWGLYKTLSGVTN
jgi:NADH:ubiquinone oxidoreductase subunit C